MDFLENPFWNLGATLRDNRQRIMELSEEKSLLEDENRIRTATSILTNPRKRLEAEMAWLPGVGPKRTQELFDLLKSNSKKVIQQENGVSPLARANLLATGLKLNSKIKESEISEWIVGISESYDKIVASHVMNLINEDREVAGFPQVTELRDFEDGIEHRRHYFKSVIQESLSQLDHDDRISVTTSIVEKSTDMGNSPAPQLIHDLVDAYEVENQEYLEQEGRRILALAGKISEHADAGAPDKELTKEVNKLNKYVKKWDLVAQPIQVSRKSRGLGHDESSRIAGEVRSVAIKLFNEHDKLDLTRKITSMLQEVFAEVVDIADLTEQDAYTLDEIAGQRQHAELLKPVFDLCAKSLKKAQEIPESAYDAAEKLLSASSIMIDDLSSADVSETMINQGQDVIALTVMQCVIYYGNETDDWGVCVELLEKALEISASEDATKRIRGNLITAIENTRSMESRPQSTLIWDDIKWYVYGGLTVLVILVILDNNFTSSSRNTTSTRQVTTQTSQPSPSVERKITFEEPPVGQNNVLGLAQIRWCLREEIYLDAMKPLIESNHQIAEFNRGVDNYNSRCGSYRYRSGNLKLAQSDIEPMRTQFERLAKLRIALQNKADQ